MKSWVMKLVKLNCVALTMNHNKRSLHFISQQKAFTLFEVLIALAIAAIVTAAMYFVQSSQLNQLRNLENKTLAHWVAMNKLVEFQYFEAVPSTGTKYYDARMAGMEWQIMATAYKTEMESVKRVEISVGLKPQNIKDLEVLTTLTSLIGKPALSGGGGAVKVFPAKSSISKQCFFWGSYCKGFTLIELMLALGIFALLGVLASTTLSSVLKTDEIAGKKSFQLAEMQRAQLFLGRDIGQIISRSIRDEFGSTQPALKGNAEGLEFTRTGWRNTLPDQNPRSELQSVAYFLENGQLIRRYWHVLDRAQDSLPVDRTILEDVDQFAFRYFDSLDKQWLEGWPPLDENRKSDLPAVIEISLDTKSYGEIVRLIGLTGFKS